MSTDTVIREPGDSQHDHQHKVGSITPVQPQHSAALPVLMFPRSSKGLKRQKREWVIPPINFPENDRGPFPKQMVQIRSNRDKDVPMHYRITGPGADQPPVQLFIIERDSGRLSVTQPLDREVKDEYKLFAHAEAVGETTAAEDPMEIIVFVIDQNDERPKFTEETFFGKLVEGSKAGFEFMKVTAVDLDAPGSANSDIRYRIESQDPESPKPNMFFINPITGVIQLKSEGLDRENFPKYTLVISAADMEGEGLSTTCKASITVTNSNNNAPQFDPNSYTVTVPENEMGALVVKMPVTDGDEPHTPAWSTKYKIIEGDNGGFFNVTTGPSKLEGIITTVKGLDFEKNAKYTLLVTVENDAPFVTNLPTSTATVIVNVEDVNEAPVFNPVEMVVIKPENLETGADIIAYTATDPDTAKNQKVWYKSGDDPAGWLNVNRETGLIKARSPMDRESPFVKGGRYRALILAIDDDDAPATGTGTLLIELEDVNDNAPTIEERAITICNQESQPVTLSVTDRDGPGFTSPFRVDLQGRSANNWTARMNGTKTGIILGLRTYLEENDYTVILRVYDSQGLFQDNTITATPQHSAALPVLMFPRSSKGLKRQKRDWVIPPINFPENDRGPFPKQMVQIRSSRAKEVPMHYKITGPGADQPPVQLFKIDRDSGWLSVTQPLDREMQDKYKLFAHAEVVSETTAAEDPMEIIIFVIDQNDEKPKFTEETFFGKLAEGSKAGFEFMKVTAVDLDAPGSANSDIRYRIESQDPESPKPNMFFINPITGVIQLKSEGLDRENSPKYTLVISAADMDGDGLSTTCKASITVTNSNNNAPQFDPNSYTVTVPENEVGALVVKMPVTDGDEPHTPAWSTKYKIIEGDNGGFFNVTTGPSELEGIITTVKGLDFEKNAKYTLLVTVENDAPFVTNLPTSTATVIVNVEDVNEAPVFNPVEKVVIKPENLETGADIIAYTATDPDTAKNQKVWYKSGDDPAGWLNVNRESGLIKVRSPMDRESPFVKGGRYRALILAIDDDLPLFFIHDAPATGTGTLLIELEDVNDNAPTIEERAITICNQESHTVTLSVIDRDGPGFTSPFRVELQGTSANNWTARMNGTKTGIILGLRTYLEENDYTVILRVYDSQGLFQDNTITATATWEACITRGSFCIRPT
ncbi:cadherin-13-like [Conger conger]|uniref:cadherin-13-like n=1 Tax=Conger conger TaxID=82655 RepID=UPI002A5A0F09|nr:cadherin-13-like [Conger conger]